MIWMRKDLNEQERDKLSELKGEVWDLNEKRLEEEDKFFWSVTDMRVRKWILVTRGRR